jgi:Tfp pilus assembly protein PilN
VSDASEVSPAGLQITDGEIRLAAARRHGGRRVFHCACLSLPPGAVESGLVRDLDAVVESLRRHLSTLRPRPRRVRLALSGRRTLCRVTRLDGGQRAESMSAARERLERYVQYGNEPIFAAFVHARPASEDEAAPWLVGAATPRQVLTTQVTAAIAGFDTCEIALVRQDGLVMTQQRTVAAEALANDGAWLPKMLQDMTDYHLRHAGGTEPVEELLWCSTTPASSALVERLQELRIRCATLDPAQLPGVDELEGKIPSTPEERSGLAPAICAAATDSEGVRALARVDLMPDREAKRRLALLQRWIALPTIVSLLTAMGFWVHQSFMRRECGRITRQLNHPSPEALECSRMQLLASQARKGRVEALELLRAARQRTTVQFLNDLPSFLPDDTWLDQVAVRPDGRCLIAGKGLTEDSVFQFAKALRQGPHVEAVRIERTGAEREAAQILAQFHLEATLRTLDQAADTEKERD